jgi:uncharacterized protein YPO0396
MIDTPRTDADEFEMFIGVHVVSQQDVFRAFQFARQLERELNAANERIKQLEDRIHRAAMAFFRDGSDGQVASGMLVILEEERNKP